jgi:hypothetical protein
MCYVLVGGREVGRKVREAGSGGRGGGHEEGCDRDREGMYYLWA